jgi:hypothetical protein
MVGSFSAACSTKLADGSNRFDLEQLIETLFQAVG